MSYRLCALIPTYNHHTQLSTLVERLKEARLPVFIVDDGSGEKTQSALSQLDEVEILRLPVNCGKGAALRAGLRWVSELGYTHAFQIDADGQHSLSELETFISKSQSSPEALLSGKPVYDTTVPWGRKIGRWFTHVWVWIETLSFTISDSMCGFRIYPVQATLETLNNSFVGSRMDFDTEIMVKMFWAGTPVLMHPVKVVYPEGNSSNFNMLYDNWRITKMHVRLVFLMLGRLPAFLLRPLIYKRKRNEKSKWSTIAERGSVGGLMALAACTRLLGRRICRFIGAPVVLYFFLTGAKQRRASLQYLNRVFKYKSPERKATWRESLRHFMSFFQMLLDKFRTSNALLCDDPHYVQKVMTGAKGGVMFVSHLGCAEFCRSLMSFDQKKRLHILMHTKNSKKFNRVMAYFDPHSQLNIVEVTEMGAETILFLKERIERGEWVAIAADRVPVSVSETPRIVYAPFLGKEAPFPQGPYILASLLQCPVYTLMSVRSGSGYQVSLKLFAEQINLPRGHREAHIKEYAHQYAQFLEASCLENPYQWYNFFDFWQCP